MLSKNEYFLPKFCAPRQTIYYSEKFIHAQRLLIFLAIICYWKHANLHFFAIFLTNIFEAGCMLWRVNICIYIYKDGMMLILLGWTWGRTYFLFGSKWFCWQFICVYVPALNQDDHSNRDSSTQRVKAELWTRFKSMLASLIATKKWLKLAIWGGDRAKLFQLVKSSTKLNTAKISPTWGNLILYFRSSS